jgi:hypothetical protein
VTSTPLTLWSFQPLDVALRLEAGESIRARPDFERDWGQLPEHDWGFKQAYDWMARQMVARIGPPPKLNSKSETYPMWAWARPPSATLKGAPDMRSMRQTETCALIELRVERSEALLSDHGSWHHVLNCWPNALDEAEADRLDALAEPLARASKAKEVYGPTWERIFNVAPFEAGQRAHMAYGQPADSEWAYLNDVSVQATLWSFEPRHLASWRAIKPSLKIAKP